MSRTKKSRTAGNSDAKFDGQRKESSSQSQESRDNKRQSKLKGNKAGARNAVESKQSQQKNAQKSANDKRLGSQKAVPLMAKQEVPAQAAKVIPQPKAKAVKSPVEVKPTAEVKQTPEKEIVEIENDQRLNELLEQLDNGEKISQTDQSWIDKQMRRHQQLMKQLGWLDEEGEEDLLQQFEDASSALNEYK
ncbi:MAG: ribosome assembly protein YihI (activator of Der GTPase) [Psychromonas sp.]|jgi:ribosome assembly protein YihI (activator of Der GTPase)|uniref:Der GTPase-activating protein YihI n=1 Tax=Psychromonas sp. TaxID=1884585 RepID=UPI0039E60AFF